MSARRIPHLLLAALAGACGSAAAGFAARDAGGPEDAQAQVIGDDAGGSSPEAAAPMTATEACSHTYGAYVYAEHAYPGRTASQLAHVVAFGQLASTGPSTIPGYTEIAVGDLLYLRDGYAAVYCGETTGPLFSSVTFTGP